MGSKNTAAAGNILMKAGAVSVGKKKKKAVGKKTATGN
jgi:hypothetical protein